jgi:hypothetical protein
MLAMAPSLWGTENPAHSFPMKDASGRGCKESVFLQNATQVRFVEHDEVIQAPWFSAFRNCDPITSRPHKTRSQV